ncbi:hypothetical protein Tco_0744714 [Tanacetum coccineum]
MHRPVVFHVYFTEEEYDGDCEGPYRLTRVGDALRLEKEEEEEVWNLLEGEWERRMVEDPDGRRVGYLFKGKGKYGIYHLRNEMGENDEGWGRIDGRWGSGGVPLVAILAFYGNKVCDSRSVAENEGLTLKRTVDFDHESANGIRKSDDDHKTNKFR